MKLIPRAINSPEISPNEESHSQKFTHQRPLPPRREENLFQSPPDGVEETLTNPNKCRGIPPTLFWLSLSNPILAGFFPLPAGFLFYSLSSFRPLPLSILGLTTTALKLHPTCAPQSVRVGARKKKNILRKNLPQKNYQFCRADRLGVGGHRKKIYRKAPSFPLPLTQKTSFLFLFFIFPSKEKRRLSPLYSDQVVACVWKGRGRGEGTDFFLGPFLGTVRQRGRGGGKWVCALSAPVQSVHSFEKNGLFFLGERGQSGNSSWSVRA